MNGVVTHFVWDGMNMVYEYTDAESSSYIYGTTGILYRKDSAGEVYTYTTSGRGDVVTVADSDGNAREYFYNAYGEIFRAFGAEPENPLLYCGEYYDAESGFIYLRNRYYEPSIGRFITEDPARDGLNWYVYCENNPVMFLDRTGLEYAPIRDIAGSYNVAFGKNPKYEFGKAYGKSFVMITIGDYSRAFYFDGTIREPIYDDSGYEIRNDWIKVADNLNGNLNLQRSAFVAAIGMVNDGTATVQTTDTFYVNDLTAMLDFASYINGSISDANDIKDVYDIFGKAPVVGKAIRNLAALSNLTNAIKNGEILSTGNYRGEAVTVQRGGYKHITATMYGVDEKTKSYQFFVKFPSWHGIPSAPEYK